MNGFLIANKPTGTTSSNVVVFVRKRLPKGTAIGHGGTLDPEASGVLPLCIGKATRLFDYIIDKKKTYVAEIQLGQVTDTQDATGQITEEREVNVTSDDLIAVVQIGRQVTGKIRISGFDLRNLRACIPVQSPRRILCALGASHRREQHKCH